MLSDLLNISADLAEQVQECSPYDEIDRTELYAAYKDRCVFNRFSPESARHFYGSIWDVFRIQTRNTNGRRLLRGIRLVPETTPDSAGSAEAVQE